MKKSVSLFAFCFYVLVISAQNATKTIVIQPKQTLYAIARQYAVPAAELKSLNPEFAPNFALGVGDKFKIPMSAEEVMTWQESLNPNAVPTKKPAPTAVSSTPKTTPSTTEVTKTTTPSSVPVAEAQKNTASTTPPVPQNSETTAPSTKPTIGIHVVKKGETASTIARKYAMPLKDLLALNKLSANSGVKIGQKLKVRTYSANPQVAPVIYKPINPTVIASATPSTTVTSKETVAEKTAKNTEISAPEKTVREEKPSVVEKTETKPVVKEEPKAPTKTNVQQDALFIDVKNAAAMHTEKATSESTTKTTTAPVAKENIPNDNKPVKAKTPTAEAPKEEKPKFVETPKDPNAPAPVKAKELAEKTNLTSVKAPLIEQTAEVDSKQLEASFNRTVNPNSKRTLRGIASVVKNPELTSSSFVLYNYAEEGDIVKVVNLMSKKVMYLKVVGKMNAGESEAVLQVTSDTAKLLQANEGRFLIEVTGY